MSDKDAVRNANAKAVVLSKFKKAVLSAGKMDLLRAKVNEAVEGKRKAERDAVIATAVQNANQPRAGLLGLGGRFL